MNLEDVVAVVLFVGVIAYSVFAGADFGAGFWDLVAGGAERGERPRALIDGAIGPVWEANHVWLIFCLVVLWTAFSEAFEAIGLTLFVPLALAAFGIVLRGAGFAFRKVVRATSEQRIFGAAFAVSSVIVPFCMGAIVGGIASGRVTADGSAGDIWTSWLNPTSAVAGVMAVVVCAYLSAVFLVSDARRHQDEELAGYFRRRAIAAAVVAGGVAVAGIFVLHREDVYVFHGLLSRAAPLVAVSFVCGVGALVLLLRDAARGARLLAIGAVATIVAGWGVAQWPYLLPETLTVGEGAAPDATLWSVLVIFAAAVVLILPAIGLLYVLDQRSLLAEEG